MTRELSGERAVPICKMCMAEVPRLARCHIYPRSLSREMAARDVLVQVAITPHPRSGFANGGMYDDNIVCPRCELAFKAADDCAIDFRRAVLTLRPPVTFPYPNDGARFPAFAASPELLHTFAMQTWLRCHLSDRPEYNQASDKAIAEETIGCLLGGGSTLATGRQVSYTFDRSDLGALMIPPMHYDDFTPPMYEMVMPNMAIFIAAGPDGLPAGLAEIALTPGPTVTVWRARAMQELRMGRLAAVLAPNVAQVDRMFQSTKK